MNHPTTCPGSVFGEMACSVCERETYDARNGAEGIGMTDKKIAELEERDRQTLHELTVCAVSWEPHVRLLGNITSEEIAAACTNVVARLTAALARANKAEATARILAEQLCMGHLSIVNDCIEYSAEEAAKREAGGA